MKSVKKRLDELEADYETFKDRIGRSDIKTCVRVDYLENDMRRCEIQLDAFKTRVDELETRADELECKVNRASLREIIGWVLVVCAAFFASVLTEIILHSASIIQH